MPGPFEPAPSRRRDPEVRGGPRLHRPREPGGARRRGHPLGHPRCDQGGRHPAQARDQAPPASGHDCHAAEVAKGRHQGPGSRRGTPSSRVPRKERWIRRIRAQRQLLVELRASKKIPPSVYREFYRRAKGGMFRSRAHLLSNLRLAGHLKEAPA